MPLPMVIRKNIKDNENALKGRLEKIEKATGKKFEVEIDWEAEAEVIDASQKERLGSIFHDDVLGAIATNLTNHCTNAIYKDAFNGATSANIINIRVGSDSQPDLWIMKFDNGKLVAEHKKGKIDSINSLSYFQLDKVFPASGSGLPAKVTMELQEYQKDINGYLDKIKSVLGHAYTIEQASIEHLYQNLTNDEKERGCGWYLKDIMSAISTNIKNNVADDMMKEGFNEASTKHVIRLRHVAGQKDYDWKISFDDGFLNLNFEKMGNINSLSYYSIEKLL